MTYYAVVDKGGLYFTGAIKPRNPPLMCFSPHLIDAQVWRDERAARNRLKSAHEEGLSLVVLESKDHPHLAD